MTQKSNCCYAQVKIVGVPVFRRYRPNDPGTNYYYVCKFCGKPCDLADVLETDPDDGPMHGWQRVEDPPPYYGVEVLVRFDDGTHDVAVLDRNLGGFVSPNDAEPKYWRPIPQPPEEDDEAE